MIHWQASLRNAVGEVLGAGDGNAVSDDDFHGVVEVTEVGGVVQNCALSDPRIAIQLHCGMFLVGRLS